MIAMKRNDRLNEVFRKFRQKRALRRFISLFSVFVLLLTINTLKMNADTLERIPSCGIAEHEHGAECFDEAGNLVVGDEMLTPDSSRFWPAEGYEPGHSQPSFDKQFARDWLKANPDSGWVLPEEIVEKTIEKYRQAYSLLTGETI